MSKTIEVEGREVQILGTASAAIFAFSAYSAFGSYHESGARDREEALQDLLSQLREAESAHDARTPIEQFQHELDQLLQASTDRFLIAAGAALEEQVVFFAWPELSPESLPVAQELQA